jgi:glycosyltransferase involved in cell wall biosynthesis
MLLRYADWVVAVSPAVRDHALRLGVNPERILLLPNGVDPELFHSGHDGASIRRRHGLEGGFVAGFCGSLKPWHGVHVLLDAVARAAEQVAGLRLLIVGDGPEREFLAERARALGIGGRVRFTGAVPHDSVAEHLAACDALVAPYVSMDSFYFSPLKLAEYVASGRWVVASAVAGLPGFVTGNPAVRWVTPGDAEALAQALADLARHAPEPAMSPCGAPAWTWTDVARRVLEASEQERRVRWRWSSEGPQATPPSRDFLA